jgi:large subunit ribosomal protein L25
MELQVKTRTILGKKVKNLRREGLIPAELFGKDIKNLHLSVPEKQFLKIYREAGENTIITIVTDDGKKIPVLISNVEKDLLRNRILAVDFYGIRMDKEIKAKVPIEFMGAAPALKKGLLVVKVMSEIEIEALPDKLPHRFEVDLSSLSVVGQSITVSDIKIPAGVKILVPRETVIVIAKEPAKEEAVTSPPLAEEKTATETAAGNAAATAPAA